MTPNRWIVLLLLIGLACVGAPAIPAAIPQDSGWVVPQGGEEMAPLEEPLASLPAVGASPEPAIEVSPEPAVEGSPEPAVEGSPEPAVEVSPDPAVEAEALVPPPIPDTAVPGVTAAAYLVMDMDTGQVVLQHRSQEPLPPASLTKVMTALVVLERADLAAVAEVDEGVLNLRASTLMGVKPGERLPVLDLLYGLMLPSGNDAAIALAKHVAGSEAGFAELMNERAKELGMRNSQFANAHGLDFLQFQGGQRTTAHDLALVTRAAWTHPLFRQIVGTRTWNAKGVLTHYSMRNTNELIWWYPGADGVKIGYTRRAKQTLIATAFREGRRLLVVLLGSDKRAGDGARLLDLGFGLRAP